MALPTLLQTIEGLKRYLVPVGFIGMWSGSSDAIPAGWALCDGTNGTPDLTGRFILGAGKNALPGTKGGAATATPSVAAANAKTGISLATGGTAGNAKSGIAVHNAALSIWTGAAGTGIGIQGTTLDGNTLPSHSHSITTCGDNGTSNAYPMGPGDTQRKQTNWTDAAGNPWAHTHGVSDPGHAHTHGVSDPGHAHTVGSSGHGHGLTDHGHTHTVTTAAHKHTVTDGGHTHALTVQPLSTLPPCHPTTPCASS